MKSNFWKKFISSTLVLSVLLMARPVNANAATVTSSSVMTVGDTMNFSYTGGMQTFTAPLTGIYKLEVYGAEGGIVDGQATGGGGYGGYAKGYKYIEKGTVLYVCVGEVGHNGRSGDYEAPYNNNRNGRTSSYGWGGGCTHIATMDGQLASIGASNLNKVLIVAGGGGCSSTNSAGKGGAGGGTDGGRGYPLENDMGGSGGHQTSGWGFGCSNQEPSYAAVGGAGLYGGHAGDQWYGGGGGGSGYTGGVSSISFKGTTYSPSMTNGVRSGNGYAAITLVEKDATNIYYGNNKASAAFWGDFDITDLYYKKR